MEPIVSSETSAIKSQTPGNYPKRNKLHLQHGESLKRRQRSFVLVMTSDLLCGLRSFGKFSYASYLFKVINFKLIIIYILSTSCNHVHVCCTARIWTHHMSELPFMAEIQKASPINGVRDTVNPLRSCYIWVLNDDWKHMCYIKILSEIWFLPDVFLPVPDKRYIIHWTAAFSGVLIFQDELKKRMQILN